MYFVLSWGKLKIVCIFFKFSPYLNLRPKKFVIFVEYPHYFFIHTISDFAQKNSSSSLHNYVLSNDSADLFNLFGIFFLKSMTYSITQFCISANFYSKLWVLDSDKEKNTMCLSFLNFFTLTHPSNSHAFYSLQNIYFGFV